jgi:hypothetical protein
LFSLLLAAVVAAPAGAQIPTKIYAQQLVDETVAEVPGMLVMAFHVTPPKSADNVIVASNIGRIGTKADAHDLRVIRTAASTFGFEGARTRARLELPLVDTGGVSIGALELMFRCTAGDDRAALQKRAARVRDALSRRILNAGNLLDPYPTDASVPTKTHAQKLVDRAMGAHPEILSLAMHVTVRTGDNIILASSFGRIGKKADDDDGKVIDSGKTTPEILSGGTRYGLELPLQDARGATIGALSVAYPYKHGDDEGALLHRAGRLRDELRSEIDSVAQLIALDP